MRIRFWERAFEGRSLEGPPWIEAKTNDLGEEMVKLGLTGADVPEGKGSQVRVVFLKEEWPIVKARIDAAFAGEDPNGSEFYPCP